MEVGIVFQSFHLVPTMTALENVALPMERGAHGQGFRKRGARIARRSWPRSAAVHHFLAELSGGEQQRYFAIARALVREPRIIFADVRNIFLPCRTGHQII